MTTVADATLDPRAVRCDGATARATIAALMLADAHVAARRHARDDSAAPLGDVTLLPHQVDAARRIHAALAQLGGALLADDVGLGKTFVALRVARDAGDALVVAPAALRSVWRDAMRRARVALPVVSIESLGRREAGAPQAARTPSLVIVDEAHHARNPATRRYRALAELTAGARVLLLSATPIHNRAADLRALLALFLGARAAHLDEAALARCIVRRRAADAGLDDGGGIALARPPRVAPVRALHPARDHLTLARLLGLPPPVPAADGGIASALVALGLVRQWASSVAALRGALRRRLARIAAMEAGVRAGRLPTAAELRRAVVASDAVQLELVGLVDAASTDVSTLLPTLRAHEAALRDTLGALDDAADDARAECVRRVRADHPGARVVAFTTYADTAAAMYRRLCPDGGACVLGARGARVAGGRLTRQEALHRFAPRAHGRPPPSAAEAIGLLVATDVLSEGIGLQDASVVVHLDLPWTPARLAQRVGRVARLGSPHAEVAVYALMPPATAEAWLGAERRLRAKLGEAARLVGAIDGVLPARGDPERAGTAPGEDAEAICVTLRAWRDDPRRRRDDAPRAPLVATVRAPSGACGAQGAVVAAVGHPPRIVARVAADAPITTRPTDVRAAMALAGGEDAGSGDDAVRHALAAIARWQAARRAERAVGDTPADRLRVRLLRRVARAVAEAPRGRRARIAELASTARSAIDASCGAGVERRLDALLAAADPDEDWLRSVTECAAVRRADEDRGDDGDDVAPVHALLLVVAP